MRFSGYWRWLAISLLLSLAPVIGAAASSDQALSIDLQQQPWTGDLPGMIKRRAIRVLVPYSRTLYFVDLGGTQRGMSYDFMRAFEDDFNNRIGRGELRVHVVFIPVSRARLLPLLTGGQGDIADGRAGLPGVAARPGTPQRRRRDRRDAADAGNGRQTAGRRYHATRAEYPCGRQVHPPDRRPVLSE
jgi:hypothetical protein